MKRKAEQLEEEGSCDHGMAWLRGPLIGKGGFGSVYLANLKNPRSRNPCYPPVMAVKSAEVSVSKTLQKEKEVIDNLTGCPCIIRCFGEEITTGKGGEMVYNMLMEYACGGTLAGLIKKSDGVGLPELDVRRYTRSILEGIDYIHSHGYVHCDLKPENIFLVSGSKSGGGGSEFVAKIGDFGLAKRAEKGKKRKFDPYLRGTAMYMAPEVVADHVQEAPCDIWALGCIVLEMFTGKSVWGLKPDITTDELLRIVGDRFAMPKIPADISRDGMDFLRGCLVRKPMFRFTAEMLLDHPFVAGLKEGRCDGCEEFVNVEKMDFSVPFSVIDDEDEFGSSYCSEEWSSTSEQDSSLDSCLSDDADSDQGMSSSIVMADDVFKSREKQVPSVSVQSCHTICSVPTGA